MGCGPKQNDVPARTGELPWRVDFNEAAGGGSVPVLKKCHARSAVVKRLNPLTPQGGSLEWVKESITRDLVTVLDPAGCETGPDAMIVWVKEEASGYE